MTYEILVHEPNGNLPTPNDPCTVDYFYRICVLPVAMPTKTTNKVVYFCTLQYF